MHREKLIVELELLKLQGIITLDTEITGRYAPIIMTPRKDMDCIRMYVDLLRPNHCIRRERFQCLHD